MTIIFKIQLQVGTGLVFCKRSQCFKWKKVLNDNVNDMYQGNCWGVPGAEITDADGSNPFMCGAKIECGFSRRNQQTFGIAKERCALNIHTLSINLIQVSKKKTNEEKRLNPVAKNASKFNVLQYLKINKIR